MIDYNTIGFNQPVLYEGIHITCRSILGYHYKVKKQEQAVDFVEEFLKDINSHIRRNRIKLLMIDYGAFLVEIPLAILLLLFSPSIFDNKPLDHLFIALTVFFALVFIVLKFVNIVYLNRDLEAFLEAKKEKLTAVGFRALLYKARFNDRAPDIFLNLLLEKRDMGLSSPSAPVSNEDNTISIGLNNNNEGGMKKKKEECVILKKIPFLRKQYSEERPLQMEEVNVQMNSDMVMLPKSEQNLDKVVIPKSEENFDDVDIEENKTQMEGKIERVIKPEDGIHMMKV